MRNHRQEGVVNIHTLLFASWRQLGIRRVLRVGFYAKKVGKPFYIRTSLKMVGGAGFEPTKSKTTDLQSIFGCLKTTTYVSMTVNKTVNPLKTDVLGG